MGVAPAVGLTSGRRTVAGIGNLWRSGAIQGTFAVECVAIRLCQVAGETSADGDRPAAGQTIRIAIMTVVPILPYMASVGFR